MLLTTTLLLFATTYISNIQMFILFFNIINKHKLLPIFVRIWFHLLIPQQNLNRKDDYENQSERRDNKIIHNNRLDPHIHECQTVIYHVINNIHNRWTVYLIWKYQKHTEQKCKHHMCHSIMDQCKNKWYNDHGRNPGRCTLQLIIHKQPEYTLFRHRRDQNTV